MLDAPDTFSVESAFWVLMAWFYRQARWEPEMLDSEEVVRFINAHADYLNKAITTSLEEGSLDETAIQRLKESCYVFSGMKTFHELNEAFPMLTDSKGNLKPYSEFEQEVTAINDSYNKLYLRTEYNFAHASAQMASRWKAFEKDGDRYYLQYRTVGDSRVRESHRKLHNITLEIESPFWDKYFPPNGFNCRCLVVQVRKEKYKLSDEKEAMTLGSQATDGKYREMFMFNPGKEMTCFPAYNPYTRRRCADCKPDSDNEMCRACRIIESIKEKRRKEGKL